ncbi:MAG: beta-galactosidase GalA [Planctomycetota bacterium]|jgi:beta-galactosidase
MKQRVKLLTVVLVLMGGCVVTAEAVPRERLSMDFGWEFSLGHRCDVEKDFGYRENRSKTPSGSGPASPKFKAQDWQIVDLPHDWAVALSVDKDADAMHAYKKIGHKYPENSVGWYRKTFEIPKSDLGKRIVVEFDGVFRDCEVWLNGHSMWRNLSGYASFAFDITDYVNYGGKNVLVVRVDASGYELWSYEGAGIYRHVWLLKTEPLHVAQWGTYVKSDVKLGDKNSTELTIQTTIANQYDGDRHCELISTIVDTEGKAVTAVKSVQKVKTWTDEEITQKVTVKNAKLWSVESPYLYKLLTTVKEQDRIVDTYETTFGIRTFSFDPDKGFFLNGKSTMLKGVCLHQDHGGVGVAIPDTVQDFRIEKMKEMGVNAYRCAHNWVAPEALEACDRLGMLVMDEIRMSGSSKDKLDELAGMVRRDRNHPSVIMWALGNEEGAIQGSDIGGRIIRSMKRVVRELDPTRPVTLAMNGDWGSVVTEALDVQGCNYIRPKNMTLDQLHEKFPNKPIILTESCCHSTARGVYEPDEAGRLTSYDENPACWGKTAEDMWTWCIERPWMAGTFIWTGFDYAGEPLSWDDDCKRLEKIWPILHTQWGIVDRCGFEKDPFYYFKSWWTDEIVLHIFPHWNWQGKERQEIRVWSYSNCEEVELIVNGRNLGRKKMPRNSHLEWKVKYEPGYIEVRGYNSNRLVATDRQETTGKAAAIVLKPDRTKIKANNQDVSQVRVEIVDEKGRMVPTANNEITFSVNDNGKVIGACNGDPACHVPESETTYPVFNGLLMVFIQSSFEAGPITLKAKALGLEKAKVTIKAEACTPKPFVPSLTK